MRFGHHFGHGGRPGISGMSGHGYKLQDPIASSILQAIKKEKIKARHLEFYFIFFTKV